MKNRKNLLAIVLACCLLVGLFILVYVQIDKNQAKNIPSPVVNSKISETIPSNKPPIQIIPETNP